MFTSAVPLFEKMPLFGKKKEKSPRRKLEAGSANLSKSNLSLGETVDAGDASNALVKLKLGNSELLFQDGEWISGKQSQSALMLIPTPILMVRYISCNFPFHIPILRLTKLS